MFRYQHPQRRFGSRPPVMPAARVNTGDDLRFFLGAYAAATAFTLAYLF